MIPLARTTVSTWVAPAWWRLRSKSQIMNARHGHFRSRFFFLHAYTTSDLRTFRRTCVHVRKECSLEISVPQCHHFGSIRWTLILPPVDLCTTSVLPHVLILFQWLFLSSWLTHSTYTAPCSWSLTHSTHTDPLAPYTQYLHSTVIAPPVCTVNP